MYVYPGGVHHTSLPAVCVSICAFFYLYYVTVRQNLKAAMHTHATTVELLEAPFSIRKVGDEFFPELLV
jgi:hypothetical protein